MAVSDTTDLGKGRLSRPGSTLSRRCLLTAAIPLIMMLVIGAVALINLSRIDRTQGWVDHTQDVLHSAEQIVLSAVNMETGLRGYLLAGQEQFLEPFYGGRDEAFEGLERLRQTVSDNPPQVARLQEAEETLRDWQTLVAQPNIELRRAIGDAPTMNDMAAVVAKGEGKQFFDKFRGQIAHVYRTGRNPSGRTAGDIPALAGQW